MAESAALLVALAALAQQIMPKDPKLLLLSGGQWNHHGYRRRAQLLQKALEDTNQFQVTICEDVAILKTSG
jgi:hypothetical protein